jgi:hypothetical protein
VKGYQEVTINGTRVQRLLDPDVKVDTWNRWRVIVNEPESRPPSAMILGERLSDGSTMIRTEVGRSRWQRRARTVGHRWRRNLQSGAYVTVEPL